MSDEQKFTFIKHKHSPIIHRLNTKGCYKSKYIYNIISDSTSQCGKSIDNPIIISTEVKLYTMGLIINYIKYYSEKKELPAPDAPLKDVHLSVIFGDEYEIFHELHQFFNLINY